MSLGMHSERRNIYLMCLISLLHGMVFYGPIATLYRQAQGLTILEITIIESISLALALVLELPWGIIADKIGYKRTMVICCMLYFVSKILFWRATNFSGFFIERMLLSVVCAGISGVDTSILYLSCDEGESQRVFGIYNGLSMAGLMIAAFVYSVVVGEDYRLAGLLTVFSYGAAAVISMFLKEVKTAKNIAPGMREFIDVLKKTVTDKSVLMFLLGVAFFNETHQTITVFLNQLQYERAGLTPTAMGYVFIIVTIVGLGGVFSARLTKKIGAAKLITFCYFGAVISCIGMAFTRNALISIAGIIMLRLGFSLVQPLQTELQNKQVFTENRATALSINAVIIDSIGVGTNICFG